MAGDAGGAGPARYPRVFVREGAVSAVAPGATAVSDRYLFLLSDQLIIVRGCLDV